MRGVGLGALWLHLLGWGAVLGRDIAVSPGTGTLSQALASAAPGDTLLLAVGSYNETQPIKIVKPITILGKGLQTCITVQGHSFGAIQIPNLERVSISGLSLVDPNTGTACPMGNDTGFNETFPLDVTMATVQGNRVDIKADAGSLSSRQQVSDIRLGSCSYAVDTNIFGEAELIMNPNTCRSTLSFSVSFTRLVSCGAEKIKSARGVSFRSVLAADFTTFTDPWVKDRLQMGPTEFKSTGTCGIGVSVDREAKSDAVVVTSSHNLPEIQGVVTSIRYLVISGVDTAAISLLVLAPYPHAFPVQSGQTTWQPFSQSPPTNVVKPSQWEMTQPPCDLGMPGTTCMQTLTLHVPNTCNPTGLFTLKNITVTCQQSDGQGDPLDPLLCGPDTSQPLDLSVFVNATSFCEAISEGTPVPPVTANLSPWGDEQYTAPADGPIYNLNDQLYWLIDLAPTDSTLTIENAAIINVTRESSSGTCADYPIIDPAFLDPISTQSNFSNGQITKTQLRFRLQIDATLACASVPSHSVGGSAVLWTLPKGGIGPYLAIGPGDSVGTLNEMLDRNVSRISVCDGTVRIFNGPAFGPPFKDYSAADGCVEYDLSDENEFKGYDSWDNRARSVQFIGGDTGRRRRAVSSGFRDARGVLSTFVTLSFSIRVDFVDKYTSRRRRTTPHTGRSTNETTALNQRQHEFRRDWTIVNVTKSFRVTFSSPVDIPGITVPYESRPTSHSFEVWQISLAVIVPIVGILLCTGMGFLISYIVVKLRHASNKNSPSRRNINSDATLESSLSLKKRSSLSGLSVCDVGVSVVDVANLCITDHHHNHHRHSDYISPIQPPPSISLVPAIPSDGGVNARMLVRTSSGGRQSRNSETSQARLLQRTASGGNLPASTSRRSSVSSIHEDGHPPAHHPPNTLQNNLAPTASRGSIGTSDDYHLSHPLRRTSSLRGLTHTSSRGSTSSMPEDPSSIALRRTSSFKVLSHTASRGSVSSQEDPSTLRRNSSRGLIHTASRGSSSGMPDDCTKYQPPQTQQPRPYIASGMQGPTKYGHR